MREVFQFHLVRLKASRVPLTGQVLMGFQFHLVRLKGLIEAVNVSTLDNFNSI